MEIRKRWHVISELIQENDYKTMVEIGVHNGRNMSEILRVCLELHCTGVEPWIVNKGYPQWNEKNYSTAKKKFKFYCRAYKARITMMEMFSVEAAKRVPDDSIDIIFIDGDHRYEEVKKDLLAWRPKIRSGGMMSGHDYENMPRFPGVAQAIDEFFGKNVVETGADHTWFIKV